MWEYSSSAEESKLMHQLAGFVFFVIDTSLRGLCMSRGFRDDHA